MIGLAWVPRAVPLPIGGCLARGPVALRLVERLLGRPDEALARLEGAAGTGLVVVFGPAAELPWLDGLVWLGRDPDAPALWLPTAEGPEAPVDLLQGAVLRRTAGAAPVVVLPDALVPVAPLPLGRAHLLAWRA